MKLIGEKNNFAIEFKIVDKVNLMGYAKIWMSNKFLGSNEDLIFLRGYLLNGMIQILNSKQIDDCVFKTFLNYKLKNIFYYLKYNLDNDNESNNTYCYYVNLGTFTDDYNVFSFFHDDYVYIVWKIINKNSNFNDVFQDKKGVNLFKIHNKELEIMVKELEGELNNI